MAVPVIYLWKRAPLIRLLLPLVAGILLQWYVPLPRFILLLAGAGSFIAVLAFFFLPFFQRYKLSFVSGLAISFLFIAVGAWLTWQQDIRHNSRWFGHSYTPGTGLVVTLEEPLVEKAKSLKAKASVSYLVKEEGFVPAKGTIIIYFRKEPPDSSSRSDTAGPLRNLGYGSQLILKKPLQEIKNSGNPGGFDYTRYSFFQGITHQVYIKAGEFEILDSRKEKKAVSLVYATRERVLTVLRNYIPGDKELGLAEALLIGYKDDLDKSLVQSYSNTGVVHIIAISGLHLGLIYWLLVTLFRPLQKRKKWKWLPPLLIITGLWAFSLLAGAQPSVLRSALMFTCIVAGESITRKTNIYNTLALSAFLLLCYNPYWLWDVGFQLSYAAVLSIVIFLKPIYNWLYFKNKLVDFIWKLNAITLAAQVLTVPLSIYHFHQFPNYFLLTNLVAVPLSSLILMGEILLCTVAFIPLFATWIGQALGWLIRLMNSYIERIASLRFSLWDGLQITTSQTILLIVFIAGLSYWLIERSKPGLKAGLIALLGFVVLRSYSFIQTGRQQKIIVYNVPQKTAIDFIDGHGYYFTGDAAVQQDDFTRNFHLKPSRILYRMRPASQPGQLLISDQYISYHDKRILWLQEPLSFREPATQPAIDLLILSQNPRIYLRDWAALLTIKQVVVDGSVPAWKARYWKRDCDSLGIPCHDVNTQGAFVMNLR